MGKAESKPIIQFYENPFIMYGVGRRVFKGSSHNFVDLHKS